MEPFTKRLFFFRLSRHIKILLAFVILCLASDALYAQSCITADGQTSDWVSIFNNNSITAKTLKRDANKSGDDQFTGGSSDGQDIPQWRWVNGQTNNKGDISTAGAVLCSDGTNEYLGFFGDRVVNNGDANIGFWFFKNNVAPIGSGSTASGFSGTHAVGDLLILSAFTGGGSNPNIAIYKWVGSGGSDGALDLLGTTTTAAVNHTTIPVPTGVTYQGQTWGYPSSSYAPNTFYEGFVNLTALRIDPCFTHFLLETRNSQSISASLQDFAAGIFNGTPPGPTLSKVDPTCTVATGNISVTSSTTGLTFSLDGGPFAPYPSGGYTVNPGNHTVTAQTATGCPSQPTPITIPPQPPTPAGPTLDKIDPTCTVSTGTITITSTTTGLTFSLDGGTFAPYPSGGYSGLAAGSTHSIRSQNSDGCISQPTSKTIGTQPQTPARPVVTIQEATLCGNLENPTLTVSCPIAGTYTLTQTGITGSQTFTYPTDGSTVIFTLKAGHKFSIVVKNTDGCTSDATNCDNMTNTCPTTSTKKAVTDLPVISEKSTVTAAPNPFNDRIRFTINPATSGRGTLDLYNMLGQKVKTVFQGQVQKGQVQTIEYSVPNSQRNMLLYQFQVGKERLSGKLLGLK